MSEKVTPMLKQYLQIKKQYEDAILMYRMGDFYEMFFDDAKKASKALDIVLTSRDRKSENAVPMCGVPYHSVDSYIAKLIQQNFKVAICEQIEDPKAAKGLVKREVIRVITPGTVMDENILESKEYNYLAALYIKDKETVGAAYADLTTADFFVAEFRGKSIREDITALFSGYVPRELIVPGNLYKNKSALGRLPLPESVRIEPLDEWNFAEDYARDILTDHFGVHSLHAFGVNDFPAGISAAGALLGYLQETQKQTLDHIKSIRVFRREGFMVLDAAAQRNLELTKTIFRGQREGSLIDMLDRSSTPMGGRLLKKWLLQPLMDEEALNLRLDAVETFLADADLLKRCQGELKNIQDIERLNGRICMGAANARHLAALRESLKKMPVLADAARKLKNPMITAMTDSLDDIPPLVDELEQTIKDNPPVSIREGKMIRKGYNSELDELRSIRYEGKNYIAAMEQRERKTTGIEKTKIKYNKIFGYFIEIPRSKTDQVPDYYERKQTLVNSERFITPELKEYEIKVLEAEEKINQIEYDLFLEAVRRTAARSAAILQAASLIAHLDVLSSFAETARHFNYIRPIIAEDSIIDIREGRHPVVERINPAEAFVPNDTLLDCDENQLLIITGPNMAGKSTYIRQTAVIVLMAQIGCFVPAKYAKIGLVDRIFTRVGASDNLFGGLSTFMIEMNETSNILHNATSKSLIILDEIGRGTSTFDGLSIAWAVAEYINDKRKIGAKTLFATHYHELTELALTKKGVKNYNIAVKEWNDEIIFLRKIRNGGTDKSYGIQVARLAGLPNEVIERAKEILSNLENIQLDFEGNPSIAESRNKSKNPLSSSRPIPKQLSLFSAPPDPLLKELKNIDINSLTPLQALNKLAELQEKAGLKARRKGWE